MSVYNNADTLPAALESILSQEGVELEFIVINDGSTDGSGDILDEMARRDDRLKIVHKKNEGLTRALIEGCAMASALWIARQDADDVSFPGRLKAQLERAQKSDSPVLVTCGAMWRTPDGHDLYPSLAPDDSEALRARLLDDGKSICAHGTAFFSKEAYERVGGYRKEFYYTQDLDLFARLAKVGPVASVQDMLYAHVFSPYSISTHGAAVQKKFTELILRTDADALKEADSLSEKIRSGSVRRANPAVGYYFIGACLRKQTPQAAISYFQKALLACPWSMRAMVRLLDVTVRQMCRWRTGRKINKGEDE